MGRPRFGHRRWVIDLAIQIVVAPALAGVSTLAARRWGERAGGLVSSFPAIVGPLLLVTALGHSAGFTARAAQGVVLGLVGLAGFAAAYGVVAARAGWGPSLLAGWIAAAVLALAAAGSGVGPVAGFVLAAGSLLAALRVLPRFERVRYPPARQLVLARMVATGALVVVLAAAATRFGAVAGGILAALPALASVLAVSTHRRQGSAAVLDLLRGMVAGMTGFVAFCEVVALLIERTSIATTFTAATLAALAVQAGAAASGPVYRSIRVAAACSTVAALLVVALVGADRLGGLGVGGVEGLDDLLDALLVVARPRLVAGQLVDAVEDGGAVLALALVGLDRAQVALREALELGRDVAGGLLVVVLDREVLLVGGGAEDGALGGGDAGDLAGGIGDAHTEFLAWGENPGATPPTALHKQVFDCSGRVARPHAFHPHRAGDCRRRLRRQRWPRLVPAPVLRAPARRRALPPPRATLVSARLATVLGCSATSSAAASRSSRSSCWPSPF